MAKRQTKKKAKKVVDPLGILHVQSTFNNTIISITDKQGDVICWASAGTSGFKGSKKSTAFAAQVAAEDCAKRALAMGIKKVEASIKGPGPGKESAVRSAQAVGLNVSGVRDITPTPHNGCRAKKRRRM
ncbi:MAG: 30S ribosomal protein S11 [Candidatus Coatesbacteria bacterium]|nr:30S ribosomal protein S11 [Candidatus Coatesbacteria bacterium]